MEKTTVVLGGYGGVGRALCRELLAHRPGRLVVAGRTPAKAKAFADQLLRSFPGASVTYARVDVYDRDSLVQVCQDAHLLCVCATIPDEMATVAEVCLHTQTDLIDILVRADVVDTLKAYEDAATKQQRTFITQAGFHPGIIAPLLLQGASGFDTYRSSTVYMAMDAVFEQPQSAHEVLHEIALGQARILEKGNWRRASFRDKQTCVFPAYFGSRTCYPLRMREIEGLARELGLEEAGVYAAGFTPFIDNVVFPLAVVLGKISPSLSQRIGGRLLHRSIRKQLDKPPRVEIVLSAKGTSSNRPEELYITLRHPDAFALTAQAVVACLQQYDQGHASQPGLHLMGQLVDGQSLFGTLRKWGLGWDLQRIG